MAATLSAIWSIQVSEATCEASPACHFCAISSSCPCMTIGAACVGNVRRGMCRRLIGELLVIRKAPSRSRLSLDMAKTYHYCMECD
ncbi:hypothetical protein T440DRAFT_183408 [Plenodomus tracheiphilus IPT5]|uniref:Uncharacterized protein n=1 Tax=Plenodomus tracheiphilus IPT5 TaxID=1408161 RepID=A0A6A7AZP4_9PLEO|nr:hypothetical protein T440DRAFT_183408 [Plenodomus tracheiphilus IPT5]